MKTEVNLFSVPWTRKGFPLRLNAVLENTLVCVDLCGKLAIYLNVTLYHAVVKIHVYMYFGH